MVYNRKYLYIAIFVAAILIMGSGFAFSDWFFGTPPQWGAIDYERRTDGTKKSYAGHPENDAFFFHLLQASDRHRHHHRYPDINTPSFNRYLLPDIPMHQYAANAWVLPSPPLRAINEWAASAGTGPQTGGGGYASFPPEPYSVFYPYGGGGGNGEPGGSGSNSGGSSVAGGKESSSGSGAATPIPASLLLFATGLISLIIRKRFVRK